MTCAHNTDTKAIIPVSVAFSNGLAVLFGMTFYQQYKRMPVFNLCM